MRNKNVSKNQIINVIIFERYSDERFKVIGKWSEDSEVGSSMSITPDSFAPQLSSVMRIAYLRCASWLLTYLLRGEKWEP